MGQCPNYEIFHLHFLKGVAIGRPGDDQTNLDNMKDTVYDIVHK